MRALLPLRPCQTYRPSFALIPFFTLDSGDSLQPLRPGGALIPLVPFVTFGALRPGGAGFPLRALFPSGARFPLDPLRPRFPLRALRALRPLDSCQRVFVDFNSNNNAVRRAVATFPRVVRRQTRSDFHMAPPKTVKFSVTSPKSLSRVRFAFGNAQNLPV